MANINGTTSFGDELPNPEDPASEDDIGFWHSQDNMFHPLPECGLTDDERADNENDWPTDDILNFTPDPDSTIDLEPRDCGWPDDLNDMDDISYPTDDIW